MNHEPPMAQGPVDRRVGRLAELRPIAEKRRQARALHDCALILGTIPGRERDANNVSKEAAIADAEVMQMLARLRLKHGQMRCGRLS